jgi:hypothetical protein
VKAAKQAVFGKKWFFWQILAFLANFGKFWLFSKSSNLSPSSAVGFSPERSTLGQDCSISKSFDSGYNQKAYALLPSYATAG